MGKGSVELLEHTLGCTLTAARAIYNGEATAAEIVAASPEPRLSGVFGRAAEGTRTLDRLHGKAFDCLQFQQIRAIVTARNPCRPG